MTMLNALSGVYIPLFIGTIAILSEFSPTRRKSVVHHLKIALHEFGGGLLLFALFYPGCSYLQKHYPFYYEWTYHFMCVIILDYITGGASVNPSTAIGFFLEGEYDLETAVAKVCGQLLCAPLALAWLNLFSVDDGALELKLSLHADTNSADHWNDFLSVFGKEFVYCYFFVLLCCLLFWAKDSGYAFKILNTKSHAFVDVCFSACAAVALRICMFLGHRHTEASMNPMVALAWLQYEIPSLVEMQALHVQYVLAFCVAPCAGAACAGLTARRYIARFETIQGKKKKEQAKEGGAEAPAPGSRKGAGRVRRVSSRRSRSRSPSGEARNAGRPVPSRRATRARSRG